MMKKFQVAAVAAFAPATGSAQAAVGGES